MTIVERVAVPVPRVTVLIGVYNGAEGLRRAIDSVLAQTLSDLELLVLDDGSEDNTAEIAEEVADPRVACYRLPHTGIPGTLNFGLRAARAPIVAILDHDDWCHPERLEHQVSVLAGNPDVAVVGVRMAEVDLSGREVRTRTALMSGVVNGQLLRANPIPNTAAAFRRDWALDIGGYDPRYPWSSDHDLWLRLAEKHPVVCSPRVLATRLLHDNNATSVHGRGQTIDSILARIRAIWRRREFRGLLLLIRPTATLLIPRALKRARRRQRGQAP